MPGRGRFITFEGGEGAGKSTNIRLLVAALEKSGMKVVATREPGGSQGAEEIRSLLVEGSVARWDPMTEALLHYAARRDHVERLIRPALERGDWVVCDRFADSTMAYQGYGHGLGRQTIEALHNLAVGGIKPDLTLILDVPVAVGLQRAGTRDGNETRYERMEEAFHQRLRDGFLDIARREADRCAVVDAARTVERVQEDIFEVVRSRLSVSFA